MEITIHEDKLAISHFTGKKGPIASHPLACGPIPAFYEKV